MTPPHQIMPPPDRTPFVPNGITANPARPVGSYRRPFSPDHAVFERQALIVDATRYQPPLELEQMGFTPHDIAVLADLPYALRDRVIERLRATRESTT